MHTASHKDKLKVYFAAPTPSTDEKRELFGLIRRIILNLNCDLTYDWLLDETELSPKELFNKTSLGILESDLVVAEVTYPSVGVGQQISLAVSKKIPVLAIHASWKKGAKRFLAGSENDLLKYVLYQKINLKTILKQNLKSLTKERSVKFNFISTPEINDGLEKESEKMGISRSQLVRLIVREWMEVGHER